MNSYEKVCILGLDGLEHNFVEKWNLTYLKQEEYGRIKVPIDEKKGIPLSPEVWASFLTGEDVHMSFETTKPPLAPVFSLLGFMCRYIKLNLGLGKKIRDNMSPKWWGVFHIGFPLHLKQRTFLDLKNSREINVPYYSYDNAFYIIARNFGDGKLSLKQMINMTRALYESRKKKILDQAEKLERVNVVFAFMHFPDVLQHLYSSRPSEIKKFYVDLDHYVSVLKSRIQGQGPFLFLIVSDHGFSLKTKTHSKHGFYSSNKPLNPKPKRITDFFHLLVKENGF